MDSFRSSATRNPKANASLTVTQLLAIAKNLLEESFLGLWVEGEVANFRPAASGHWYFTLKDAQAELKVAMFRGRNIYATVCPANGARLRIRGRVTVFEARGELQMVAEQIEDAGAGAAARAFELLKAKLAAEGLFDTQRKRALPLMPRRIALISSSTGAAVHDFLIVLARRFPLVEVEIWPVLVQGEGAAAQICVALRGVAIHALRYDVVVLTRGGGSAQDLASFNDEALVRAVAASPVPVVSAVGHEIDVSLCDLAADLRAATPTAAAELITPDQDALRARIKSQVLALRRNIGAVLEPAQQRVDYARRLLDAHAPHARLQSLAQRLARAHTVLQRSLIHAEELARARLLQAQKSLLRLEPSQRVESAAAHLQLTRVRLIQTFNQRIAIDQHRMDLVAAGLQALSPKRTLERGYVLVRNLDNAQVLSSVQQLPASGAIRLHFHDGECIAHTEAPRVSAKPSASAKKDSA